MTSTKQQIENIEWALYDIYQASPFVTVKNSHTETLWAEFERLVGLEEGL